MTAQPPGSTSQQHTLVTPQKISYIQYVRDTLNTVDARIIRNLPLRRPKGYLLVPPLVSPKHFADPNFGSGTLLIPSFRLQDTVTQKPISSQSSSSRYRFGWILISRVQDTRVLRQLFGVISLCPTLFPFCTLVAPLLIDSSLSLPQVVISPGNFVGFLWVHQVVAEILLGGCALQEFVTALFGSTSEFCWVFEGYNDL